MADRGLYKSIFDRRDHLCAGADLNVKNETDAGADHGDAGGQRQYPWFSWDL